MESAAEADEEAAVLEEPTNEKDIKVAETSAA